MIDLRCRVDPPDAEGLYRGEENDVYNTVAEHDGEFLEKRSLLSGGSARGHEERPGLYARMKK